MINPKLCPFCNKENLCEVDIPSNSCWCNNIKVPHKLRELIPDDTVMNTSICRNCIDEFNKDNKTFIEKYDLTKSL